MIWLFGREYISSRLLVLLEPSSTQKTGAKWEILSFRLWLGVMQPPSPNWKINYLLIVFFSQPKVMQVCIPKTHSHRGWREDNPEKPASWGRHSLKWTIHTLRFERWLHYCIFILKISALRMVSKVTRIIGLLSLSAISNKKLLSTSQFLVL